MKIVYCINSVGNSAGMERVLMEKANWLANVAGHDVVVCTTQQHGRQPFFSFSRRIAFHDLGVDYDDYDRLPLPLRVMKKRGLRKEHRRRLEAFLRQARPDITVSMFDYDFSFLYKIKAGGRKVLEYHFCHDQKILASRNPLLRLVQRLRVASWGRVVARYDAFVVLTDEDRQAWGDTGNIVSIPNPIPAIPARKTALDGKRVLSVGRLTYQKGFDRLLRAWARVASRFPDWKLTIRGGGDRRALQQQACSLGVNGSVEILPPTDRIEEDYLDSSVYAMTSRYEGMPMVLLEAISYGLPAVAMACPSGPSDLIRPGHGSLVADGDERAFAEALAGWMHDGERRREAGEKGRAYAARYVQDRVMQQWLELFGRLTKGERGRQNRGRRCVFKAFPARHEDAEGRP